MGLLLEPSRPRGAPPGGPGTGKAFPYTQTNSRPTLVVGKSNVGPVAGDLQTRGCSPFL